MGSGEPGRLWVDDVRYYEGTPDQPLGPNMLPEGGFEGEGEALPPRWALFVKEDGGGRLFSFLWSFWFVR